MVRDPEKSREYRRQYYLANKEKHFVWSKAAADRRVLKVYDLILGHFEKNPCGDCGEPDPVVLDFDHRDASLKSFTIGDAVRDKISLARIKEEIAKCDVRCANCHRRMTFLRMPVSKKREAMSRRQADREAASRLLA